VRISDFGFRFLLDFFDYSSGQEQAFIEVLVRRDIFVRRETSSAIHSANFFGAGQEKQVSAATSF
jgi:hypothetical protein